MFGVKQVIKANGDFRPLGNRHFNEHMPSTIYRGSYYIEMDTSCITGFSGLLYDWVGGEREILEINRWSKILDGDYQDSKGTFKEVDIDVNTLQQLNSFDVLCSAKKGVDFRNVVFTQIRAETRNDPGLALLLSKEVKGNPMSAAADLVLYRKEGPSPSSILKTVGQITLN